MEKISVVIPSYNEEANLKRGALEDVAGFLNNLETDYEVIVVDDGSSDRSVEMIKQAISDNKKFKLIQNKHGGKANTVMTGLLKAEGDIVLFTDMDQATPLNQLEKMLPKFEEGFDIVIGSRQGRKGAPLLRKFAALGFSVLRKVILGMPFKDTQTGFKAFTKVAVAKIIPKIKNEWGVLHFKGGAVNAGFDVELLYVAGKYGFQVAQVPVEWKYVDTERVQVVKDAMAAIYDMFRIRVNDVLGKYDR